MARSENQKLKLLYLKELFDTNVFLKKLII